VVPKLLSTDTSPVKIVPYASWLEKLQASADSESDPVRAADTFNPALKLLDFFQALESPATTTPLRFETREIVGATKTLGTLGPVTTQWMALWMEQWGF
jgi:hypothetical protein